MLHDLDGLESDETRLKILQAALSLFNVQGMHGTTIRDIRDQSGISVGSIYHHYDDKEGVAFALYRLGIEDMHQRLLECLNSDDTLEGMISACISDYLQWYQQHPKLGLHLFQFSDARFVEGREEAIETLGEEFLELFAKVAAKFGRHNAEESRFSVVFVTGGCREFLRNWLQHPNEDELKTARARLISLSLAAFGLA